MYARHLRPPLKEDGCTRYHHSSINVSPFNQVLYQLLDLGLRRYLDWYRSRVWHPSESFLWTLLQAWESLLFSKIHVDRYKHRVYTSLSNPFLQSIFTTDHTASRFHACERFNRCESAPFNPPGQPAYDPRQQQPGDRLMDKPPAPVYVNPTEMGTANWQITYERALQNLRNGMYPTSLVSRVVILSTTSCTQ
jgi:hypothetical protein